MATEKMVLTVIRASRPSFRSPHDKVAFAVHASFLAAGFFLNATGKNALSDNPPIGGEEVGFEGWDELVGSYDFLYLTTEMGQKKNFVAWCTVIGEFLTIDCLNLERQQKEPLYLLIRMKDYLSDDGNQTGNYGDLYKDLKGLVKNLNSSILAKLESNNGRSVGSSRVIIRVAGAKGFESSHDASRAAAY